MGGSEMSPEEYKNSNRSCSTCGAELYYDAMKNEYLCQHAAHNIDVNELIHRLEVPTKSFVEYDPKKGPPAPPPPANDQMSLADAFENDIEAVVFKYCGQGMTIGSALGALQNRMFHLMLNIHLPSIIEAVRKSEEGR